MESAKVLLTELKKGKRCINLDESAVNSMDFRRRKWVKNGSPNTHVQKDVTPRLSMIAAIDNLGGVYWAVL